MEKYTIEGKEYTVDTDNLNIDNFENGTAYYGTATDENGDKYTAVFEAIEDGDQASVGQLVAIK